MASLRFLWGGCLDSHFCIKSFDTKFVVSHCETCCKCVKRLYVFLKAADLFKNLYATLLKVKASTIKYLCLLIAIPVFYLSCRS